MNFNKLISICLIVGGVEQLLIILIVVMNYTSFIKFGVPIAMQFIPKNTAFMAGLESPLEMTATAYVLRTNTMAEDGYLVVGEIDWKASMEMEKLPDSTAAIYIDEASGMGEIQRTVMKPGPLNYGSLISWLMALIGLGMMVIGLGLRCSSGILLYDGDEDDHHSISKASVHSDNHDDGNQENIKNK